ncbi:MAG: PqqD family peptide modification chaperone [Planctomycetota bacterium]|nr:MAG: PqqD family peptide modification chaperone [Planctomycetota bacterium]
MPAGPVLGLNQYTHSAAACLLDTGGRPLFAGAKERLSRRKHDGGDTADLVGHALERCGLEPAELAAVVANNHLFRIDDFERRLPWSVALGHYRPSFLRPENLLPGIEKWELSHHLAHAWSVLPLAPFARGLILVMDGIGSTWRELHRPGERYHSDAGLPRAGDFRQVPAEPERCEGWREAETVYRFDGLELELVFKRWTRERTPVLLHNYGFENMESLGAVYSRVASHVFGHWNDCGKVMGLAPWAERWDPDGRPRPLLRGPLEELAIDWSRLESEPHPNEWEDEARRPAYARLAADLQLGLEEVVLDFLRRLRERTGERNLCLAGGVALNSTLNGRIARECGFDRVFVPPWPGDDGIAVGCALWGRHRLRPEAAPARSPWFPLLGAKPEEEEIAAALAEAADWVEATHCDQPAAAAAAALDAGEVVAWYRGPAEFGPRALGNRSILADPRRPEMVDRINAAIKKREAFRPFAPTVLAEEADAWFAGVTPSPYMSLTVPVRPERAERIPAVVHVDGTARIQTLAPGENEPFRAVIEAFRARTGLPLVLNTSFNIRGEPLVETPADALRSFLDSDLDLLVLEDRLVRKRPFPTDRLSGLRPRHLPGTAEQLSDQDGEPLGQRILCGGRSLEVSSLQLGLWEQCDGQRTFAELAAAFAEEWEVPPAELTEALADLWRRRLVRLDPGGAGLENGPDRA